MSNKSQQRGQSDKTRQRPAQSQSRQPGRQGPMRPAPRTIRDDYRGSGKLHGKVALVSGGDSGIGRSVAVMFAREEADLAIVYLEEQFDHPFWFINNGVRRPSR